MSTETVTLVGGPADGQHVEVEDGVRVYEVAHTRKRLVTYSIEEVVNNPVMHKRHIYLRSTNTRKYFVYQP